MERTRGVAEAATRSLSIAMRGPPILGATIHGSSRYGKSRAARKMTSTPRRSRLRASPVPDPHGSVSRRRHEELVSASESQRGDWSDVPVEARDVPTGGGGGEGHHPVRPPHRDPCPAGAPADCLQPHVRSGGGENRTQTRDIPDLYRTGGRHRGDPLSLRIERDVVDRIPDLQHADGSPRS